MLNITRRFLSSVLASFALVSLLTPKYVDAATTKSLYALYDVDYEPVYPEGISETITNYNKALRYVTAYRYIAGTAESAVTLVDRVAASKRVVSSLADKLHTGYFANLDNIYTLEDEYSQQFSMYSDYVSAMRTFDVQGADFDFANIPTYKEYCYAKAVKERCSGDHELGLVLVHYPVIGKIKHVSKLGKGLKLKAPKATAKSIFNGRVTNVSRHSVTLSHYDGIYTYYGGLDKINVRVGDAVSQGAPVGNIKKSLVLKMKLANKLVDIEKIFQED